MKTQFCSICCCTFHVVIFYIYYCIDNFTVLNMYLKVVHLYTLIVLLYYKMCILVLAFNICTTFSLCIIILKFKKVYLHSLVYTVQCTTEHTQHIETFLTLQYFFFLYWTMNILVYVLVHYTYTVNAELFRTVHFFSPFLNQHWLLVTG